MSPNRKADLQRKLSLASIPKPPAGLADRIKSDIPQHLLNDTEQQRQRLGRAVAFNMRVAASILLLVGSLFFALHLLNHASLEEANRVEMFEKAVNTNMPPHGASSPTAKYDVHPQVVTSTEQPPSPAAPPRIADAPRPAAVIADAGTAGNRQERSRDKEEVDAKQKDQYLVDGVNVTSQDTAPSASAGRADELKNAPGTTAAEPVVAYASGRAAPQGAPAPQPTPAAPPPPPAEAQAARKAARPNLDLLHSAEAADLALGAPEKLFGYDLGTKSLGKVTPQATPNVTPLVQHFAAPASRPRHGVRIEADGVPSPLDPSKVILRISLDTPTKPGPDDASPAPVASDARLEIGLDPDAVTAQRTVTGEPAASEHMLVEGVSVTFLYEVDLKPSLGRHAHVATVRLRYRSPSDGHEQVVKQEITFGNVAKSWDAGKLRTQQKAALAAAFAETRAQGGDVAPIVEKARALGLTELAEMAKKP